MGIQLKALEEFKTYSRRQGMEVYDSFVAEIQAEPEKGRAKAMAAIAEVKSDPEWAALLVAVCATLSEADGRVGEAESDVIEEICTQLDLDAATVKAYEVDFYDELHE